MFSNTLSRSRAGMHRRATGIPALALAAALACSGCRAPVQRIPIDVEPASALLFVDGAELPALPTELSLRADESHVLFFRGAGYLPQRIILESRERERLTFSPNANFIVGAAFEYFKSSGSEPYLIFITAA